MKKTREFLQKPKSTPKSDKTLILMLGNIYMCVCVCVCMYVYIYIYIYIGIYIHLQCRTPRFDPWFGKIPWRRQRLPTPVFWPGEFHGLYSPWGCKAWNMTEQLTYTFTIVLNLQTILGINKILFQSLNTGCFPTYLCLLSFSNVL